MLSVQRRIVPRRVNNESLCDEQMHGRVSPHLKMRPLTPAHVSPIPKYEKLRAQTRQLWRGSSPRHDNGLQPRFEAHIRFFPAGPYGSRDGDLVESEK